MLKCVAIEESTDFPSGPCFQVTTGLVRSLDCSPSGVFQGFLKANQTLPWLLLIAWRLLVLGSLLVVLASDPVASCSITSHYISDLMEQTLLPFISLSVDLHLPLWPARPFISTLESTNY